MKKALSDYMYCSSKRNFSAMEFSASLNSLVNSFNKKNGPLPILFFCIGSDRVPGDCLGPLVGYKLEKLFNICSCSCCTMGSLNNPIHAVNIERKLKHLALSRQEYLIIAIDASIGDRRHLGNILLSSGPVYPGEGVSKKLPPVGAISITAVTGSDDDPLPFHQQIPPLSFIMELADCIYNGISAFIDTYCFR